MLQALEALVWSIATLILFGCVIWMLISRHSLAWSRIVRHSPPGRRSTHLALGMTLLGFVVTLVSTALVLTTSWASRWLSTPQWSLALVVSTGSLVGIGWLCTEVSHQGRLAHDLSQEIRQNNALRAQVTQAYMRQQHLVQRQQELLQERDRLYREQVTRAERDALTGLCNHRTLMSALEHLLTRCREEGAGCAVLFLDLDHFKQINDMWGHRAGDALLHQIGKSIQQCMAELDTNHVAGRYGGEEFMVLLFAVNAQEAAHIANQLRARIEQEVLVWRDEHLSSPVSVRVTASIGMAVYPIHATRYQDLIHRGDQAMYQAKQHGGNRVCIAGTQGQWTTSGEGQTEGLTSMETMTEQALLALLQARDSQAYTHGQRMAGLTEAIAKRMKCSAKEVAMVRLAALLRDLGKVGVSEELLSQTGPLTAEEQDAIQAHPTIGHAILVQAGGIFSLLAPIVAAHHEHWDGSGHPRGLQRESIPFLARIVAVIDAFDEMTSPSADREARGEGDACAQLIQGAGTRYDPNVVQAFLDVWSLRQRQRQQQPRLRASIEQE
ncbi:diguanylate cyclase [Ktedonobacter sp. SOSP1-85]|uniref:diguanylate cyclase n=1 Tax=Ktedonobacter sp. SOSP1-85 TaxID=2778367 RepID=UPI001F3CB55B|nr:diguanylate cyclase [Ktedonobacter sp. SOSP1-85]